MEKFSNVGNVGEKKQHYLIPFFMIVKWIYMNNSVFWLFFSVLDTLFKKNKLIFFGIPRETVSILRKKITGVISNYLEENPTQLSTNFVPVQIDETCVGGRKKYGIGKNPVKNIWVLGIIDEVTKK